MPPHRRYPRSATSRYAGWRRHPPLSQVSRAAGFVASATAGGGPECERRAPALPPPQELTACGARSAPAALDMQLYIAAFHFKLGDVLLHQQLYEFFDFFLIHRIPCLRSTGTLSCAAMPASRSHRLQRTAQTGAAYDCSTSISSFVTGVSTSHPFFVTTTISSMRMPPLPGT